jgi:hypothetical protein
MLVALRCPLTAFVTFKVAKKSDENGKKLRNSTIQSKSIEHDLDIFSVSSSS